METIQETYLAAAKKVTTAKTPATEALALLDCFTAWQSLLRAWLDAITVEGQQARAAGTFDDWQGQSSDSVLPDPGIAMLRGLRDAAIYFKTDAKPFNRAVELLINIESGRWSATGPLAGRLREAEVIAGSFFGADLEAAILELRAAAGSAAAVGKGMSCDVATQKAEAHCRRNPFPGVNALADIVGCAPSTMSKAVDKSPKLRAMLTKSCRKSESVSAGPMNEKLADSVKSRGDDPSEAASQSTDNAFRRLLEQARPDERAKLNAMTPEKQRELVARIEYDPERSRHTQG